MPTTGTSALSNEVKALYDGEFYMQGQSMVYHDQFCDLRMQMNGQRGNTYNFPILESGQPNYTALDELEDVAAQQMRANEIVVTLYEYGGAIEITKFVTATSYADVAKQAGLPEGLSFEMLRYTCAVRDYQARMDPDRLRRKLGLSMMSWRETEPKIVRLAEPPL